MANRKTRRHLAAVRSKMRSVEEMRQEYGNLCAQAGEIQYKIKEFTAALNNVNQQIGNLNREFNKAKGAQDGQAASTAVGEQSSTGSGVSEATSGTGASGETSEPTSPAESA